MRPFMILHLPLPEHRRDFEKAAFEMHALLDGTDARMVIFKQGPEGPVPVELVEINETNGTTDATDGSLMFVGYILGPEQSDGNLDVMETWWGEEIIRLLDENGLKHIRTEGVH